MENSNGWKVCITHHLITIFCHFYVSTFHLEIGDGILYGMIIYVDIASKKLHTKNRWKLSILQYAQNVFDHPNDTKHHEMNALLRLTQKDGLVTIKISLFDTVNHLLKKNKNTHRTSKYCVRSFSFTRNYKGEHLHFCSI